MRGASKRRVRLSFVSVLLLAAMLLCFVLVSCKKSVPPYDMMLEFCKSYGIEDTVFSSTLSEGEHGFANDDFFELIFEESADSVSDYAIVFLSSLDKVGECVLFLCYSEYDALVACDTLRRRADLLKSMGTGMDVSYALDAKIFKSGKYAIMCALPDNERAERLWRKIL